MTDPGEYDQAPETDVDVDELLRKHDLISLFKKHSFSENFHRVVSGLKQPRESGEYKYAKLQVMRLSAPASAVVVPVLALAILTLFAKMAPPREREVEVQIIEPEALEQLEEIEDIDEPIEPPEPIDVDFTPDVVITDDSLPPTPNVDFSPQPAQFDSVAIVKSPVIMKGIFGSRTGGARGSALAAYGGSGITEGAVLRALRWLKKNQNTDGSWDKNKSAMTSLALLSFLAHGETTASPEFGDAVQRAIRFLVECQGPDGHFKYRDGHDYTQPIATYALCEAYALTKIPMVKDAAEKAIVLVIQGQNPSGGFNYNLKPTTRDDTSYMGWCAQALKAAKMAKIEAPGLEECMRKAIDGFKKNSHPNGGFGYTAPTAGHGLTGVGVLCMQLLGAAREPECRAGLTALDAATFEWGEGGEPAAKGRMNKNYYWYYITQAKFHHGGDTWDRWNNLFAPVLVKKQTIIEDAIEGPDGKLEDIGWWDMPKELSGATDGPVMNTALCALQLQVYYRYLPTFKPPVQLEDEDVAFQDEEEDIKVDIEF